MQAIAAIIGDIGYGSLPSFLVSRDIYDSTRFAVVVSPADLGLGKAYLEDENIADLGALHCVSELCGGDPQALRELFEAWASGDRRTARGRGCPALSERFLIR